MSTNLSLPSLASPRFRKPLLKAAMLALFAGCGLPMAFSQQTENISIVPRIVLPRIPDAKEPVQLTEMDVRTRIVGLNAEVTTTLTFLNPNKRLLEGELEFPLPDNAGITGYALDINGKMVDGVVVKKEKARIAFETESRRRVDPGLVEHVAGNVFRTRVYPLPAGGVRRVSIRYVAPLAIDASGDAAWHLPMPVGETIGKLGIRVEVSQGAVKPAIGGFGNLHFESFDNVWIAKTELADAKPGEDLWVALPRLPAQVSAIERTKDGDTYFSVSDLLPLEEASKVAAVKPPAHLGIAWDASGSREGDKHLKLEAAMLKKLLASWPDSKITLLVFRDRTEEPREFAGDRDALLKFIDELAYDGGTDLTAVPDAMKKVENVDQWLLFTDGFDTLSGTLPDFGKQKITAVVSQTVADRELLNQACAASGGQVVDLQNMEPDAAVAAIINPPVVLTAVHGSEVAEVQGIGQVVHGRAAISGKLTGDTTELTLEYSNGQKSPPVKIVKSAATDGDLLATVWASRRIQQLSVRADDNEDELLSLGQRFGIVSPATSLIVLETLDQYVRNEIEPPASLPELRKAWADTMETRTKQQARTHEDKLNRLLAMWNARLEWWNADYKTGRNSKLKKGIEQRERENLEDLSTNSVTPAPAAEAPVRRAMVAETSGSSNVNEHAAVAAGDGATFNQTQASPPAVAPDTDVLKSGAGAITLSGSNTYSGATTVNDGAQALTVTDGSASSVAATQARVTSSSGSLTLSAGATTLTAGSLAYTSPTATGVAESGELSKDSRDDKQEGTPAGPAVMSIAIKPWDPATPYLRALKAADKKDRYATYLKLRKNNETSPAFFLDCADYFFREGDQDTGIRILTNLAEMKLEDAPLLRVLAWRFEQAGELDRAITMLRRVLKLRPEEPQSLRDLALALAERGKPVAKEGKTADLSEALALENKLLFADWQRNDEVELVVLEEMNALIAWINTQSWDKSPVIPELDKRLRKNLDEDVRIVMSWDADATDVDLHVIEPTGEEAFYSHNRTAYGGLVSHDITTGYGPEEYLMRKALTGTYKIFAHYYGSSQQTVTGAVTVTATVFTNYGRPNEKKQVLTLRLDRVNENAVIGKIRFDSDKDQADTGAAKSRASISREDFAALKAGQSREETLRLLGEPAAKKENTWSYEIGKRRYRVEFTGNGTVQSVTESLPGNAEMILVQ